MFDEEGNRDSALDSDSNIIQTKKLNKHYTSDIICRIKLTQALVMFLAFE